MKKQNNISWNTEKRKVSELKGYEHNPRFMTEKQFEDLKQSITEFNYVELIAVNTNNVIVAGHMRIKALIELGRGDEMIDVRIPNRKLSKKEFEEYLIRSNKNKGEWDQDILKDLFQIDDLRTWGFTEDEMKFTEPLNIKEME